MSEHLNSSSNICAVILAGGLGTRLRPVFPNSSKVLAPVLGRPFITYLLDQLDYAGVKNVVLCIGYKGDLVREELGDSYGSLTLTYSREEKPLGTGGALRLALPVLDSNPVLVMNGDSYVNENLSDFLTCFLSKPHAAALLLKEVPDTSRYGQVILDGSGRVRSFQEKGGRATAGWINSGVYLLEPELIQEIPPGTFYSLEQEFFPFLIDSGLYGYPSRGEFIDIGTPESYVEAEQFFQKLR